MVGRDVILIGETIFLSQFLDVIKTSMFTVPFLAHDGYDRMDDLYGMGRVKMSLSDSWAMFLLYIPLEINRIYRFVILYYSDKIAITKVCFFEDLFLVL